MATASRSQLSDLLGAFQHHRLNISEFLVGLLAHSAFTDHPAVDHLLSHTDDVLGAFLAHQQSARRRAGEGQWWPEASGCAARRVNGTRLSGGARRGFARSASEFTGS
ncbi:hypothetical protein B0H10DRAFT_1938347 [Mycena sp. CBHHK59/15]|nr:hypothetical protein B0H10DRAFT_1938347 [Mycena sp. CBHHK59/15]